MKASGWQTTAIAAALAALFLLIRQGALPDPGPLAVTAIAGSAMVAAGLALASILSALMKAVPVSRWWNGLAARRRRRKAIRKYIPFMTEAEREIVAYLLHHKIKSITAAADGGYATTLISRGFLACALRSGQVFSPEETPFFVPDEVWLELEKEAARFPYTPTETHPWRVPWMVR